MGEQKQAEPLNDRIEGYFIRVVELYAQINANIANLATKDDIHEHSENCEAKKNHRTLVIIGAMLSGAGLVFGIVLKTLI